MPPTTVPDDTSDARVLALYDQGCRTGSGDGCNDVGIAYAEGKRGVAIDRTRALSYFELACERRHRWGCVNLGVTIMEEDAPRARKILETGCTLQVPHAYTLTTTIALNANDDAAALDLAKRACEVGGDAGGCAVLGRIYLDGRGTPKDSVRSASLFKRACDEQAAVGA